MLPIFGILTSPQHQNLLIQNWLFNASRKRKDTTLSKSRLCNITRVHCWSRPIIWPLKQWLRQGKSFIKRKNKKTKLKQLTPCKVLWCIPTSFVIHQSALHGVFLSFHSWIWEIPDFITFCTIEWRVLKIYELRRLGDALTKSEKTQVLMGAMRPASGIKAKVHRQACN